MRFARPRSLVSFLLLHYYFFFFYIYKNLPSYCIAPENDLAPRTLMTWGSRRPGESLIMKPGPLPAPTPSAPPTTCNGRPAKRPTQGGPRMAPSAVPTVQCPFVSLVALITRRVLLLRAKHLLSLLSVAVRRVIGRQDSRRGPSRVTGRKVRVSASPRATAIVYIRSDYPAQRRQPPVARREPSVNSV